MELKCLRPEDFLDALVGMTHIDKDSNGAYFNTPQASKFCVKTSPLYIGRRFQNNGDVNNSDFKNLTDYLKGKEINRYFKSFDDVYNNIPDSNHQFADYMKSSCKFVSVLLP